MDSKAYENTDIRLFTDSAGNEVFATKGHEGLGINVGGHVIVKPLAAWHALAKAAPKEAPSEASRGEEGPGEADCGMCKGRGFYGSPGGRCEFCKGTGKVKFWRPRAPATPGTPGGGR